MNSYHRWRRGVNRRLSPHFMSREFDCGCGICAEQRLSENLLNKLEEIRVKYGAPIKVVSAFRCQAYQARLRRDLPKGHTAVGRSTHEDGDAVDVRGKDLALLTSLCEDAFKAVGIADTFVHVDTRADKVRRWKYT